MPNYTLYTQLFKAEIIDKLKQSMDIGEIKGTFQVMEDNHLYTISYECFESKEKSDEKLAHLVSDVIQKQAILKVCTAYLSKREDLSLAEKKEVTDAFLKNNYLSRQEGFTYITYYLLYLPIYEEIRDKQKLHLEGCLQFRVKRYLNLIKEVLTSFTVEYLAKKEVVDFIELMRAASLVAIPLEEVLHIVYQVDGKIQLYNSKFKNMTAHYIKKYCKELLIDTTLTREDLLLHILITIYPREIIIHGKENMKTKQFINTLEIIFEDSIKYCEGCEFCKKIIEDTLRL